MTYLKQFAPQMNVTTIEKTLSQQIYTYQKTRTLLKKNPDIDAIRNCVCHAEEMAQAVIDAGRQNDVRLIAFHFNSPSSHIYTMRQKYDDHRSFLTAAIQANQADHALRPGAASVLLRRPARPKCCINRDL